MASAKINQLQLLQQNLQNILFQKQQFQNQLVELDSALSELRTTEKAYKIVGKLMIASSKQQLIKDLEQQKEIVEIRIKTLTEQEDKIQHHFEDLQKEVVKEMEDKKTETKK